MNMRTSRSRARLGLSAFLFFATLPSSSCSSEPAVLTIGDVAYTENDLLGFNGTRRTRLAELTAFGLSVSRGEAVELGGPLIQRRTQESLLDALEQEIALRLAGMGEEELKSRYRQNPEYELTVRHLVFLVEEWASEEEEARARERAQEALARIREGEDFAAVAGEVSEEPGAAQRGGLLEPGRRGSWVDDFWAAASALEVGEVSPVIRSEYGFHVLKLEERSPVPFPEARRTFVDRMSSLVSPPPGEVQAWVDSVFSGLVVDSTALRAAYDAAGSLFILADAVLEEDSGKAVATWEDGAYMAEELQSYLLSQDRPSWEHLSQGGVDDFLRVAADAARRSFLAGVAGSMGVALSPSVEEAHRRDWEIAVRNWAESLGFRQGMGLDEVKRTALEAVAATGQGASLARRDIQNWAPMLLAYYPIGPETEQEPVE